MLECLIYLVIYCIVAVVVLWAIEAILGAFNVTPPPPISALLRVLVVLLVVIAVLNCLGLATGGGLWHPPTRGNPAALQKIADDLDATAAETQAAIDANSDVDPTP